MFIQYKTQGFFLEAQDRGEADRLFTVFTKKFGKLKILGRSIRKIKSKLRAGSQLFSLSYIEFIQGRTYKTLTEAIVIKRFPSLVKNPHKFTIATDIAEKLCFFLRGEESDQKIWKLLLEVFDQLNDAKKSSFYFIVYHYFLWNFFSCLGYKPHLTRCVMCGKKVNSRNIYFSPENGGVVCSSCFKKTKKPLKINKEVADFLRFLFKKNLEEFANFKINSDLKKSLKRITSIYLRYLKELY